MNTEGLEQLDVNALGGADRLVVDDLSATTTSAVTADLPQRSVVSAVTVRPTRSR